MTKIVTNRYQQCVWDRLSKAIDECDCNGVDAYGKFNESVLTNQRKFLDGIRLGRLLAVNSLKGFGEDDD